MSRSIRELLTLGTKHLTACGIETGRLDATLLLSFATGLAKTELIINDHIEPSEAEISMYMELLGKRAEHTPLKYITKSCEFMGLDFYVDENVLIPRPDTEILVETAIKLINEKKLAKILEIGTGSGCIAVSLAHYLNSADITASDISSEALNIAIRNAEKHNERICFIKSDIFGNISKKERFDCIISNPPYIQTGIIETLPASVKNFEPRGALDGGADGLYFYRKIAEEAKEFLNPGGMVMFEIGYDEYTDVRDILKENGYKNIEVVKDLSGLDRVVFTEKGE